MSDLSAYPITHKWPAQHPERLQLYSLPTPKGVKASILLEALGQPYEAHLVSFDSNDQLSAECLSRNPNNKIPASSTPTAQAANHWSGSSLGRS
jgi:GST-like protein